MTDEYRGATPTEDEARALIERLRLVERDGYLSATYLGNEHVGELVREAADTIRSLLASRVSTPPGEEGDGFCDQCAGPHEGWLTQYGGHWDTCPNRVTAPATPPADEDEAEALARAQWADPGNVISWDELTEKATRDEGDYREVREYALAAARLGIAAGFRRQVPSTPEPVRHISDKRASGMEPTDEDEREALATILATWRDDSPEEWAIDMYRDAADAILAAGFRRQVVSAPEPEWEFGIRMVGTSRWAKTTADHVGKVKTWHNGVYEFARRTAPGDWEPVPTIEGEA